MARKKAELPARPGFEPAKGNPDPEYKPPPVPHERGFHTHLPHSNGPVCGLYPPPQDAKFYDPVDPSCPACANYLAATKRVTQARHGATVAAAEANAEHLSAPPPTPRDRP